MKKTTLVLLGGLMISVAACNEKEQAAEAETTETEVAQALDLSTDKAKFSYAVGYQFARTLKDNQLLEDIDVDIATAAIEEKLSDGEPSLSEEEVVAAITAFQTRKQEEAVALAEESAKASETFMEENKSKEGVITTESGLQYTVVTEGTGASPSEDSDVEVNYKGTLINGEVFDSSYDRGQSATFPVANVIPGFREGMMLMKEGGKSILYIPAALAYGKQAPPSIGPDQALIFEVELIKVK